MFPLNDKDLDRLSREAAEQLDPEAGASGWEKLEARLDHAMPVEEEKRRKRFLWLFLLGALLCGSGLTWMLSHEYIYRKAAMEASRKPEQTAAGRQGSNAVAHSNDEPGVRDADSENPTANTKVPMPESNGRISETEPQIGPLGYSGIENPGNRSPSGANGPLPADTRSDDSFGIFPQMNNGDQGKSLQASFPSFLSLYNRNQVSAGLRNPGMDLGETKKTTQQKSKQPSRFTFGLLAGTDVSRINGSRPQDPGFDLGLTAAFRFSKRWSLNTGFILTMKNYEAKGDDYHPPKSYWTNYIDLDELDGDCYMWEIPLSLRYDLKQGPKLTWFASAGLTSYIMRKQNYTYYYTYNNTPRVRDWSYRSQDNYWMGLVHISGGFEKKLSASWSIQAEPFVKLPLKGIGYGNMKINSYGLSLSVRFTPLKNTPRNVPKTP